MDQRGNRQIAQNKQNVILECRRKQEQVLSYVVGALGTQDWTLAQGESAMGRFHSYSCELFELQTLYTLVKVHETVLKL
ncbi:hypothetical protein STEG23_004741, partial [Scotinomys teguina]